MSHSCVFGTCRVLALTGTITLPKYASCTRLVWASGDMVHICQTRGISRIVDYFPAAVGCVISRLTSIGVGAYLPGWGGLGSKMSPLLVPLELDWGVNANFPL